MFFVLVSCLKKVLEGQLAKAKSLRAKHDTALNAFNEVTGNIATNPQWSWATAPALVADMNEHKAALDAFKASSQFWGDWSLLGDFSAKVRRRYDAQQIGENISRLPILEKLVGCLADAVGVVLAMHHARTK